MTLTLNYPVGTDLISNGPVGFPANWAALNSAFLVDHTAFNVAANQGEHKKITLQDVALDPGQAFPHSMIYTKHPALPVTPNQLTNLFFSYKPETGVDVPIQMTFANLAAASGQGGMPGGLQIRCGACSASGAPGSANPITPAFPTACLSVIVTPSTTPTKRQMLIVTAIAANSFTLKSKSSDTADVGDAVTCYYAAIGH